MTILIVDDHAVNLRLLRAQLEAENFTVIDASDGAEALRTLGTVAVNAIITDVLMPNVDGFRLCREVRAHPKLWSLPLVIYTSTYNSPEDRKLAQELGADAYIVKPAPVARLIEAIDQGRRRTTGRATPPTTIASELDVSRQYSQALVRKLEEKNAELASKVESLLSAEDQLRLQGTALETAANAVVITARSGTIRWVNPAFAAMTGYSAEDVAGKNLRLLKSGRHDEAFYRELWRAITAGETWRGEFINRRKDGSLYHGEQTITPVRGADRAITHFVGVMNDITARRHAEETLRATAAQLHHLLHHSPVVTYLLKIEGERQLPVVISENLHPFLGFTVEEALVEGWWPAQLHPDDRESAVAALRAVRLHGQSRLEYRIRHKSDGYRWVEDKMQLVRDADGRPDQIVGVWADITERKRAEEVLQDETARRDGRQHAGVWLEVLLVFVVVALAAITFFFTDVLQEPFERFFTEHPWGDEIVGTILVLVLGLGFFSYRRWKEARTSVARAREVQTALRTLHAELETRVQLRTAELAVANQILRAEIADRKRAEQALEQERALMRTLIDQIPDLIYVKDGGSRFLLANEALATLMGGASPAALLGRTDAEFYPPSLAAGYRADEERVRAGEPIFNQEEPNVLHDGAARIFLTTKLPLRDAAGEVVGIVGIGRDITERKRMEEDLRESERRFREMLENLELIAMTLDREGRVTFCNDYLLRLTGWSREETMGSDWFERFLPRGADEVRRMFFSTLDSGTMPAHYENPIITRAGELRDIVWNNTMLRDAAGAIIGTASIGEDVTERKRTEAVLRQTRNQYQSIFQNAIEGIYQTTPAGVFIAVNPAMARIFGYASPEELMHGRRDIAREGYVDARMREEFKRRIEAEGSVRGFEYEAWRKDGTTIWVSENARVVRDEAGAIVHYEGSVEDITERKLSEERAQVQHAITAALAEATSLAQGSQRVLAALGAAWKWDLGEVWLVDRAAAAMRCAETWHPARSEFGAFVDASRQLTLARGQGLVGRVWASGRPGCSRDVAGVPDCIRKELAGRIGLHGWIGFPIRLRREILGVVGFFSTSVRPPDERKLALLDALGAQIGQFIERQQLAEQFRQAQKMEAIGTLAGGIAHDFNNIIAAISGYTELARMELRDNPEVAEHLEAVLKGSARATTLVRQILAFSRQQEHAREVIQTRHIVHEALGLLRATIPATIEFDTFIARDLPTVLADATQVHQVVMNLCTNAAHAMKDRPGRLGVQLESVMVDEHMVETQPGLHVGEYVRLSVSDTGHGMDTATLGRIFEPFFTTKAPGQGTGLGLSVVHGIVQSHEGVVTVYSQPGEGTVFRVYLPALQGDVESSTGTAVETPRGKGERILFVDDEQPLAFMGGKILEQLGYRPEVRASPVEALEAFRAAPENYDLVITDFAMPVMTGADLAQQLLALRADIPIIIVSGYAASPTVARAQSTGVREVLLKPLSVVALAMAVRRVLNPNPGD